MQHLTLDWTQVQVTMSADGRWRPDGDVAPLRAVAGDPGRDDEPLSPAAAVRAARLLGWRVVELVHRSDGEVDVTFHRPG